MPTLRSYPQVTNLLGTDAIMLDRVGVGTVWIQASDFLTAINAQSPYDVAMNYNSTPPPNANVLTFIAARDFTLPANFVGSQAEFITGPSAAPVVLSIQHNGATVGTITFNGTGNNAVGVFAGTAQTVLAGDTIDILTPAALNGAANLTITLAGTRIT